MKLHHGEAGRQDYYIVPAGYQVTWENLDAYDWSASECTEGPDDSWCGECHICISMMIDQEIAAIQEACIKEI